MTMEDAILTKLLDYGTLGILAGVFIYISISLYRKYEAKNEQIINDTKEEIKNLEIKMDEKEKEMNVERQQYLLDIEGMNENMKCMNEELKNLVNVMQSNFDTLQKDIINIKTDITVIKEKIN